jgi:hypothetical protein
MRQYKYVTRGNMRAARWADTLGGITVEEEGITFRAKSPITLLLVKGQTVKGHIVTEQKVDACLLVAAARRAAAFVGRAVKI